MFVPLRSPIVLYEDNHCLVLAKPAGLLTMGDASGSPTALQWAKAYLKERYRKRGNVYVGVVHRLDVPVSGVLLFARTSKAAARLTRQFQSGAVEKLYWAIVEGRPAWNEKVLEHYLWKDRRRNVVQVVSEDKPGAKWAQLEATVLGRAATWSFLQLKPKTGRSHQIRAQLATVGLPIVGDRRYGARTPFSPGIALHARRLRFEHPTRKEPIEVECPLPTSWQRFQSLLAAASQDPAQ